jgi:hypothetical protein
MRWIGPIFWVAIAFAAVVIGGPNFWDHLTRIWDHLNKQSVRDSIILSSPTIYTRQRLVNDRLSQADWLSEQLKMTETEKARDFKSVDALSINTNTDEMKLTATLGGESAAEKGDTSGEKTDSIPTRNNTKVSEKQTQDYELKQTTLDRFVAMNMYRDTVRTELMHTLLDDRHDINGNTIYRLGFDATVLGGNSSNQLAIIFIKFNT